MPAGLAAALAVTVIAGFLPLIYIVLYRMMLGIFWKKADGKVIDKDNGIKIKASKADEASDDNTDDIPVRAVIEFQVGDKTVKVPSRLEYDKDRFDRAFPSENVKVYYSKTRPDKYYFIGGEYKRQYFKYAAAFIVLALLAAAIELTAFIYMRLV